MKILDVNDFCSGIDTVQKKLYALEEQMKQIQKDVDTIIGLEDSFKGAGGKAIRSFYRECHRTFLFFYQEFSTSYKQTLRNVTQALRAFESAEDGYIKVEFLEGKVEQGLENIKSVTEDLTAEANGMMDKVSDIVSLTKLNDDEVLKNIASAQNKRDETIKKLNEFDSDQTKALHSVEQDIVTMKNYIKQMESMFQSGNLTIQEFSKKQFTKKEAFNDLKERLNQKLYENVFDHCQNPFLSKKEFNRIKDEAVKKVQVFEDPNETKDISGTYYQMKNGLVVREYMDKGKHYYQIVDRIPQRDIISNACTKEELEQVKKSDQLKQTGASLGLDFVPIASNIKSGVEAFSGEDPITKEKLDVPERILAAAGIIGGPFIKGVKWGKKGADAVSTASDLSKKSDKVHKVEKRGGKGTGKAPNKVNYGDQYTKDGRKKVLKENVEYTTKEGYTYKTDSKGRISSCEGNLEMGEGKRNNYAQRKVGREDRLADDEGGHLIASIFKGSGNIDNLVPMNGNLNKGEWKKLENSWADALRQGDEVKVKITPNYKGDSKRPDSFEIKYKIGEDGWEKKRFDNVPGGKLDE